MEGTEKQQHEISSCRLLFCRPVLVRCYCAFKSRSATAVTRAAPLPLPSYESAKSTSMFCSAHNGLVMESIMSANVGCFLYTVPSTPTVIRAASPFLTAPVARSLLAILWATAAIPDAQRYAARRETA